METKYKARKLPYIIFFLSFLVTVFIVHQSYSQENQQVDNSIDTDKDGLTDYQEKTIYQTFYYDPDTDDDGYKDGEEVQAGYSPKQPDLKMTHADTDNDGLNDAWEIALGTNLMVRDTDNDGYLDGTEVYHGYSPTKPKPEKVEKLIEVIIADFQFNYYINNILVDSFKVSTGKPRTPTPVGEFIISHKYPIKHYYGYPNTKWNLQFHTNPANGLRYYIHGAYWHELFGQKNVSGGCVNVPYEHMERIYNMTNEGTRVIIR